MWKQNLFSSLLKNTITYTWTWFEWIPLFLCCSNNKLLRYSALNQIWSEKARSWNDIIQHYMIITSIALKTENISKYPQLNSKCKLQFIYTIVKTHITAHLHVCTSISVYQEHNIKIRTRYIISFDPYQIIYYVHLYKRL